MDDIAKTIADMMRDPEKVAIISKNLVDLGALFEHVAETLQALAREVEKMGEAASETTAEPERPTFKVGQRVQDTIMPERIGVIEEVWFTSMEVLVRDDLGRRALVAMSCAKIIDG